MQSLFRQIIKTGIFTLSIMSTTIKSHAQSPGKYAQVNGIKMYYEIHGTGHPLVLIHGGGSTMHTSFDKIMPELAKTHMVIGIDLQNHGRTSARDIPETFEEDADDVATLLTQLNITGANVVGFSNGGSTTLQLGIRHPELVHKLIAISAVYKRNGMFPWLWDMMKNPTLANMPQIYKDVYLAIPGNTQAGLQNMHDKDAQRMVSFKDWPDEQIKSIQAPTLVIVSDQDVVTPEHAIEMSRLLPHGRLAIMPGTHGEFIGEIMAPNPNSKIPELFVAMLNEYLAAPIPGVK
ncbi:alpha/beta fold hydrolase [Mucilaginibacter dorajii]|uniref:AB hydrolase-1 domain-containing protein n=1 Tax=Mucilaginibacter dorajii TaxID=692994 RepID=A0ABP7QM50_9SPHI|nr:alpha/beta hydrolase [Mucilaginibacter dorajii]